MPRIPLQQMSTNVPTVNVPTAAMGASWQGVAAAGEGLARAAEVGFNIYDKVRQEEGRAAALDAAFNDRLESDAKLRELETQSPDGYIYSDSEMDALGKPKKIGTVSEVFSKWANDRYRNNQKSMPNALGQDYYAQVANDVFRTKAITAQGAEAELKVASFSRKEDERSDRVSRTLFNAPTVENFFEYTDGMSLVTAEFGRANMVPISAIEKTKMQSMRKASYGFYEGLQQKFLLASAQGEDASAVARYALATLDGNDQYSMARKERGGLTAPDILEPEALQKYKQMFTSMLKTGQKISMEVYNERLKNTNQLLEKGDPAGLAGYESAAQMIQFAVATGQKEKYIGDSEMVGLVSSKAIFDVISDPAVGYNPASIRNSAAVLEAKISEGVKAIGLDPTIGGAAKQNALDKLEQRAKQVEEGLEKNPIDTVKNFRTLSANVIRNSEQNVSWGTIDFANQKAELRAYLDTVSTISKNIPNTYQGTVNYKPLSQSAIDGMTSFLRSKASGPDKAKYIQTLFSVAKPHEAKAIMGQLTGPEGKMDLSWNFIFTFKDNAQMLSLFADASSLSDAQKSKFESSISSVDLKNFKAFRPKAVDKFTSALMAQSPDSTKFASEQADAINTVIKNAVIANWDKYISNKSPAQAVEDMSKSFIDEKYHLLDTNQDVSHVIMMVPKEIDGVKISDENKRNLDRFIYRASAFNTAPSITKMYKSFGMALPEKMTEGKDEESRWVTIKETGHFIASPDGKSLRYVWAGRDGPGIYKYIKNESGDIWEMPLDIILNGQYDLKTLGIDPSFRIQSALPLDKITETGATPDVG